MATTLHPPPLNHPLYPHPFPTPTSRAPTLIHCGPRSNRGPLLKGRILSSEAILAVQSLKRAHHNTTQMDPTHLTKTLSRLIKADLIATLRELLRQDQCTLALKVFSTVRSEPWYSTPDLALYADLVLALGRSDMWGDVDRLMEELEMDGGMIGWGDRKGLSRLVRALIGGERRESTVRIYRVMKRSGWGVGGSGVEVDEYVAKVLSRGFKRFGEVGLAKEVDLALERYLNACLGKVAA